MAVSDTPVFVQTPKVTPQNFVQGVDAAGTYKTIFTAGADGSKVMSITVTTTDTTTAHALTLVLTRSAVDYILNTRDIDGTDETNMDGGFLPDEAGLPSDSDGQRYIFLESGDTLRLTFATALTAATRIDVVTTGANF
jgi:hypothetical protein